MKCATEIVSEPLLDMTVAGHMDVTAPFHPPALVHALLAAVPESARGRYLLPLDAEEMTPHLPGEGGPID